MIYCTFLQAEPGESQGWVLVSVPAAAVQLPRHVAPSRSHP